MLSNVLSKEECSKCQICCCFDSYDIWETPVINNELHDYILSNVNKKQRFITKGDSYLLRLERESEEELFFCSVLDREKGCKLSDKKPFDCKIWPFRIMDLWGKRVITLSPICPVLIKKPIDEIMKLAQSLAPTIFSEADKSPSIVKKYLKGYPILVIEDNNTNK